MVSNIVILNFTYKEVADEAGYQEVTGGKLVKSLKLVT